MPKEKYYSVRMRAAKNGAHEQGGKHISGGELLSTYNDLKHSIDILLNKALTHSRGKPDFMQIQFDLINEPITRIKPLPIKTNQVNSVETGQALCRELLALAGIRKEIIEKVYTNLPQYEGTRGAVLIDIQSGERIDNREEKGVRVSRMDWINANFEKWADYYKMPKNLRMKEALVLATKVCAHPNTIAELCWSDDPEYITGYVANKYIGYQRITQLKKSGDERGCRIFFVNCQKNPNSYIHYLEKQPVFIQWEDENGTRVN